jgi:adenylate cyclase
VCPVFDQHHEVAAVVYGFRNQNPNNKRRGIRPLEVQFVQLVTDAISTGLVRIEKETELARKRVLLRQAFAPEVARQLENDPRILDARDREVTVLFADLRGFSSISERHGAKKTYQLLTDVMNRFDQIITDHQGVVLDFFGDGISAFWNAPVALPDHPLFACQAAMEISRSMTELNEIWAVELGQRLRIGVGIHTGTAQVGNAGSQYRLKYGPQGNTVNIASRLEHAAKKLGIEIAISGEMATRVAVEFETPRICVAQLAGLRQPMQIHRLVTPAQYAQRLDFFCEYAEALRKLESGNLHESIVELMQLQIRYDADLTIEFLLRHAQNLSSLEQCNAPRAAGQSTGPCSEFHIPPIAI